MPAVTTLLAMALHIPLSASAAGPTVCADETLSGSLNSVVVAPGASCTLEHAVLAGDFNAVDAADVVIHDSEINGSVLIESSAASTIDIRRSSIAGNLELLDNVVDGTVRVVDWNSVAGNVLVEANQAGAFLIGSRTRGGNAVAGDVMVLDNESRIYMAANNSDVGGDVVVAGNFANEDIIIWDNRVAGNVRYDSNVSHDAVFPEYANSILLNTVAGDLSVVDNEAIDPIEVSGNQVNGNLECEDNDPQQIATNQSNQVSGDSECGDHDD